MTAYTTSEWSDLFVATAGASAALTGLLFVAVSINLERILSIDGLPERALATMTLLLGVVLVSIIGLIPGQSTSALGAELLVESIVATVAVGVLVARSRPGPGEPRSWLYSRVFLAAIGTVPFVIGAVSIITETGGGLYWVAAGIIGAVFGGVANAWVLLVEILR